MTKRVWALMVMTIAVIFVISLPTSAWAVSVSGNSTAECEVVTGTTPGLICTADVTVRNTGRDTILLTYTGSTGGLIYTGLGLYSAVEPGGIITITPGSSSRLYIRTDTMYTPVFFHLESEGDCSCSITGSNLAQISRGD